MLQHGANISYAQNPVYGDSAPKQAYPTTGAPPATLSSAISRLDELNKFLSQLSGRACELASIVGGPFPVEGEAAGNNLAEQPPSAVSRLNDMVGDAIRRARDIEGAVAAMARSLGA